MKRLRLPLKFGALAPEWRRQRSAAVLVQKG
jgi:hypothetical protein